MNLLLYIVFWGSVFLVFYTYIGFPFILSALARRRKFLFPETTDQPAVTIVIAAYNEEKVIREKIESVMKSEYPAEKIHLLIGSDNSNDQTNTIIRELGNRYPALRLIEFNSRTGKPGVVNVLMKKVTTPLTILTDANVYFTPETIKNLVRHFHHPQTGLVGGNILNIGLRKDGISIQEKSYIQRENLIKYQEGILWGTMMGPFGGCYMIRTELYEDVPRGSLVDDFYISMKILQKKFSCLNDLDAICYEDVPNQVKDEFKRKARISTGNFQNLSRFRSFLLHPFTKVGYCFISHKFLRWITPLFLLLSFLSSALLSLDSKFYLVMMLGELLLLFTPFFDRLFHRIGIHISIIRFISYFVMMNVALAKGFFLFIRGANSGVWEPTKRV